MCTAHGCAPCFRLAAGALRRRLSCGKPYPISGLVATYPLADFKRPPNPSYLKDNRVGTPEHTRTGTRESRFCKVTDGRGCTVGGPSLGSGLLFPEVGPHHWLAVRRQATHLSALLSLTRLHAQGLAGAAGAGALREAEWVPLASSVLPLPGHACPALSLGRELLPARPTFSPTAQCQLTKPPCRLLPLYGRGINRWLEANCRS